MGTTQLAAVKKSWVKPLITERSSVSRAKVTKPFNVIETTVMVGTVVVSVGPGS